MILWVQIKHTQPNKQTTQRAKKKQELKERKLKLLKQKKKRCESVDGDENRGQGFPFSLETPSGRRILMCKRYLREDGTQKLGVVHDRPQIGQEDLHSSPPFFLSENIWLSFLRPSCTPFWDSLDCCRFCKQNTSAKSVFFVLIEFCESILTTLVLPPLLLPYSI